MSPHPREGLTPCSKNLSTHPNSGNASTPDGPGPPGRVLGATPLVVTRVWFALVVVVVVVCVVVASVVAAVGCSAVAVVVAAVVVAVAVVVTAGAAVASVGCCSAFAVAVVAVVALLLGGCCPACCCCCLSFVCLAVFGWCLDRAAAGVAALFAPSRFLQSVECLWVGAKRRRRRNAKKVPRPCTIGTRVGWVGPLEKAINQWS